MGSGDPLARRVALGTARFMLDELATAQGGFASSLDADAAGVEGGSYVWTPDQLRDVLGEDDGGFAADLYGVTPEGTFEHGTSVLRMARDIDEAAEAIRVRAESVRGRLLAARAARPCPARDEKVVAKLLLCEVGVTYARVMRVSKWAGSGSSEATPYANVVSR